MNLFEKDYVFIPINFKYDISVSFLLFYSEITFLKIELTFTSRFIQLPLEFNSDMSSG